VIRVLVCALLLAACSHAPTEKQVRDARDEVISGNVTLAFFGCQTALNDPKTEWADGARAVCERLVNGCHEALP
jgi:hypothetical protein